MCQAFQQTLSGISHPDNIDTTHTAISSVTCETIEGYQKDLSVTEFTQVLTSGASYIWGKSKHIPLCWRTTRTFSIWQLK